MPAPSRSDGAVLFDEIDQVLDRIRRTGRGVGSRIGLLRLTFPATLLRTAETAATTAAGTTAPARTTIATAIAATLSATFTTALTAALAAITATATAFATFAAALKTLAQRAGPDRQRAHVGDLLLEFDVVGHAHRTAAAARFPDRLQKLGRIILALFHVEDFDAHELAAMLDFAQRAPGKHDLHAELLALDETAQPLKQLETVAGTHFAALQHTFPINDIQAIFATATTTR